jgi:hypothetical protein
MGFFKKEVLFVWALILLPLLVGMLAAIVLPQLMR